MWNEIEARAHRCGEYIVATQCTVRTCADALGTSKSTVHKDVTERLPCIDPLLADRVKAVLEIAAKNAPGTPVVYAAFFGQKFHEHFTRGGCQFRGFML